MEFQETIGWFRKMCDESPVCKVCQFNSGLREYLGHAEFKREKIYQSCNDMLVRYPHKAEAAVARHMQHGCLQLPVEGRVTMEEVLRE